MHSKRMQHLPIKPDDRLYFFFIFYVSGNIYFLFLYTPNAVSKEAPQARITFEILPTPVFGESASIDFAVVFDIKLLPTKGLIK